MSIELCKDCKKPFSVKEDKLGMPGTREKEPISCPYCGYTIQRSTNGSWVVKGLDEIEQKKYLENN